MPILLTIDLISYFDPLEQFDVIQLLPSISYSLTNLTLILLMNLLLFGFLVYATTYPNQTHSTSPSIVGDLVRNIYEMIANLAESNIRLSKQVYFPILFYIFMLILVSNLVGMIPFSYTVLLPRFSFIYRYQSDRYLPTRLLNLCFWSPHGFTLDSSPFNSGGRIYFILLPNIQPFYPAIC